MAHWAVATRPTILQVWPVPARRSLKSYRPPSVKSGSPATSQAGGPLEIGEAGCVIVLDVDLVIPDQMLGDIEPLEGAPPPGNHFAPAESGRLAAPERRVVDGDRLPEQVTQSFPLAVHTEACPL